MAGVLIGLALLAFWLFSLFDVVTTPEDEVRNVPKPLWIIIVVVIPLLGGVVWMARGRPRAPRAAWPVPRARARRRDRTTTPTSCVTSTGGCAATTSPEPS
ncbi:PLDc N-terminal domain-containing protein [Nonomuraea rubra]|uniref:PLDc N-terminal domain-containing protein n=1 Tax=Nonomuraea rubra TaxID=46180 RepID=UPI00360B7674